MINVPKYEEGVFMGRFATFVLGGIVGAAAGVLLAPAKGEETRKQVATVAQEVAEQNAPQLEQKKNNFVDAAAKTSTVAINAVIDKGGEIKSSVATRASSITPTAPSVSDETADELREKIDAARERIAAQVAKNTEAIQDAAVDKIPVVIDAAAQASAAVSGAVDSVKGAIPKPGAEAPADACCMDGTCTPAEPAEEPKEQA